VRRLAVLSLLIAFAACRAGTRRTPTLADAPTPDAAAPDVADGLVRVPDVRGIPRDSAISLLRAVGLAEGEVFTGADLRGFPAGSVAAQEPRSGSRVRPGTRVVLEVAPSASPADPPPSVGYAPPPPAPTPPPAPPSVSGDAVPAPRATGGAVPDLAGLSLPEAQDLAQRAGYELLVERVPGHPVGRVLSQEVAAGPPLPLGAAIPVRVTAGGDQPGATPPPPVTSVDDVPVPSLLDRTPPVARRVLESLGLSVRLETATRGTPGLVVDQRPLPGERIAKGGEVAIFVGPPEGGAGAVPAPAPSPPAVPGPDPDFPDVPVVPDAPPPTPAVPAPESPAPSPPPAPEPATPPPPPLPEAPPSLPPAPAPAPAGALAVPSMLTPADRGVLRGGATAVVILSWTAVDGATGYVIEVEEQSPTTSGGAPAVTWLPILQKAVVPSDVSVEIRPANGVGGEFRWRVRTLVGKRGGRAAPWWTFTLR
jgi:beta-lactam-binding protein with PASTA domain